MEVAGLCSVCQRPGALATCGLCGQLGHRECLASALHVHGALGAGGGRGPPPGART